ncbi:sodium:solute symporter family protein [Vibrio palustris]|uniref:Putative symporter YodF n=1 Tax=Vibrio palustris TaxID=1918946 RepID=A0A1R4B5N6_9VIBR|nr:sodium:solute symporter family protein [Vibrio palustris]SJL84238.1 putative symporter YodF [Vibrio palustris]
MSSSSLVITGITVVYLIVILCVGLSAKRGQKSTLENYVAGGRSVGFIVLFFIFGAECFSASAFLGTPGWAYSKGMPVLYIVAYLTLGVVVWWLMGPKIANSGRKKGLLTQAEFFTARYPNKLLGVFIGIISLAAMIPYLTVQIAGAGMLFHSATGGAVPFWLGALIATTVVAIYVFVSGLSGIGWTNLLQGVMMVCIAWYLGLATPEHFFGGVGEMFAQIKEKAPEYLTMPGATGMGWGAYTTAILVSSLGIVMWPHIFMKFYTAESGKTLKRVFVFYPLYGLIMLPLIFIGFTGVLVFQGEPLAKADDVLLELVVNRVGFSDWVIGIVLSGALAAAMSTASNLAHTSASIFSRDILYPMPMFKNMNEKQMLLLTRLGVIVVSLLAYALAMAKIPTLAALLLAAYGIIVQLFPMLVGALWWKKATTPAAVTGLIIGSVLTLYFQLFGHSPFDWNGGFVGLIANSIVFIAASLYNPATHEQTAEV